MQMKKMLWRRMNLSAIKGQSRKGGRNVVENMGTNIVNLCEGMALF